MLPLKTFLSLTANCKLFQVLIVIDDSLKVELTASMKSNPAYFKCFFRKKLFSHRIHINVRSFKGTINYLLQFYTEALHIYAYLKMAWKYLWLHLQSYSSIDRK